ncbi:MAG TPA: 1-deoxy-D-xylulose-5-phosphate reductoisomerase [Desulfomonilaceae bacterium]|nr:1-deoxy-D-xylulose-5-phosphate reductoisomerase [Desulfomonilaceae bacterium]
MKGISILGSTGSIGVQTLDVVRLHPTMFKVAGLAAGSNVALLEKQIREFSPSIVTCSNEKALEELKQRLSDYARPINLDIRPEIAATAPEADLVVGGLPGSTGLEPTFAAVEAGKDVALATKEVLVMAGALFMELVEKKGVALLPVDSEQSAIFQCLKGNEASPIRRIILTASGGPFRDMPIQEFEKVTKAQALDHPRWKMGPKVTVDSATLMNKGLEVIEAKWLFQVPSSKIEVVIHPQSIVHSMVEFDDGSIMAQLGATDMRIPISYALAYPERVESGTEPLDFPALASLTFREPDTTKFPLLKAAYQALEQEGPATSIVLNAADEVAVDLFLAEKLPFKDIPRVVLGELETAESAHLSTLADIMEFHDHVISRVRRRWDR